MRTTRVTLSFTSSYSTKPWKKETWKKTSRSLGAIAIGRTAEHMSW